MGALWLALLAICAACLPHTVSMNQYDMIGYHMLKNAWQVVLA